LGGFFCWVVFIYSLTIAGRDTKRMTAAIQKHETQNKESEAKQKHGSTAKKRKHYTAYSNSLGKQRKKEASFCRFSNKLPWYPGAK